MQGAYSTYFDNLFLSLRMARPDYKAQAQYSLRTIRQAALGAAFTPLLAELETAINGFDENLTDSNQSTAGGTEAFRKARTAWLEFVGDTMLDHVTPKLRKLPIYADFKKFGKSKLADLRQPKLLTESKNLLGLYQAQQAALYPTLGADAQHLYDALAATDETRDQQDGDKRLFNWPLASASLLAYAIQQRSAEFCNSHHRSSELLRAWHQAISRCYRPSLCRLSPL